MLFLVLLSCCFLALGPAAGQLDISQYFTIEARGVIAQSPNYLRPDFKRYPEFIAFARFNNRIDATGWAELELVTNGEYPDEDQAYYAGLLEGFLTSGLIEQHATNINPADGCKKFEKFIVKNLNRTIERVKQNPDDPYWKQVALTLYQLTGLDDGAKWGRERSSVWKKKSRIEPRPCGVILANLGEELDDLKKILKMKPNLYRETKCSAIVKVVKDGEDVLVAHNTWGNLRSMLRIMKKLTLNYSSSVAKSVVMSSYPGFVSSVDDYYITSQQLVVQETTNEVFNDQLYDKVDKEDMIFEFIRNIVANRLATSGAEWTKIFSQHNSGTYNNQFMVVDYKRFKPKDLQPGFLTISEQIPGKILVKDVTDILKTQTYWPSYNIPYLKEIYDISGYKPMAEKYGEFFTYDNNARANIMRRDHGKVHNISTLYTLMRYNDFKHDPLSKCNCTPPYTAEFSIAARNDLNDPNGTYPYYKFGFRPTAAIDAKMTNHQLALALEMVAISGPSAEQQPVFDWRKIKVKGLSHIGQPIIWDFDPVYVTWDDTRHASFPDFMFDM